MTSTATLATRLHAAADDCEELEEALRIAKSRRNELIAEAHDEQAMTYGQLARHTRLSRARIIAIIGGI